MADVRIFLTTTGAGNWTVPADCVSATIECIGGGGSGGGSGGYSGVGGGGGAYAKKNSLALTPGASIPYQVGGISTDTWFKSTLDVLAKGGAGGGTYSGSAGYPGGAGGLSSNCVGDVKYSGGNGGNWPYGYLSNPTCGGGAAGPNGAGLNGGGFGGSGGAGDNGFGGAGGGIGAAGGAGTEWDATHGSGGGGGMRETGPGGAGGLYGGAGGGNRGISGSGGLGKQGLIVITYTPVATGSSSFFQLFN